MHWLTTAGLVGLKDAAKGLNDASENQATVLQSHIKALRTAATACVFEAISFVRDSPVITDS